MSLTVSVLPSTSFESIMYDGESWCFRSALGSLLPIPGVVPTLSSAAWSKEEERIKTRLARAMGAGAGVTWICGISDVEPDAELLVDPLRDELAACGRVYALAAVGEPVV